MYHTYCLVDVFSDLLIISKCSVLSLHVLICSKTFHLLISSFILCPFFKFIFFHLKHILSWIMFWVSDRCNLLFLGGIFSLYLPGEDIWCIMQFKTETPVIIFVVNTKLFIWLIVYVWWCSHLILLFCGILLPTFIAYLFALILSLNVLFFFLIYNDLWHCSSGFQYSCIFFLLLIPSCLEYNVFTFFLCSSELYFF